MRTQRLSSPQNAMTRCIRKWWLLFVGLWLLAPHAAHADQHGNALAYGETVMGALTTASPSATWTFSAQEREQVDITVRRISGQFTPRLLLRAPDGAILTPATDNAGATGQSVSFSDGFPVNGAYTIEVMGDSVVDNFNNPPEYSLTLIRTGQRRATPFDDLNVPDIDGITLPSEETGDIMLADDDRALLAIDIYGTATVVRPDAGNRPGIFNLRSESYAIEELDNSRAMKNIVEYIRFMNDGLLLKTLGGAFFLSDQNFTALVNTASTLTARLTDGTIITTDFHHITSILAVDNIVLVNTVEGQQFILNISGKSASLLKANNTDQLVLTIGGERLVETDLTGWHTIAYNPQPNRAPLAIFYGPDFRILSAISQLRLTAHSDNNPPFLYNVEINRSNGPLRMAIDPSGMGDLEIKDGTLTIHQLDGRAVQENYNVLRELIIENRAIRFQRIPGSFRTVLPDGTDIETPANYGDNTDPTALPHQTGYIPQNQNNLGTNLHPVCECLNPLTGFQPVNPVNGNFHYAVTDFNVPSHTLELDYTRRYNSQDTGSTPPYMLNAPTPYLFGQVGRGWRHSYQMELDITGAPVGQILLIMPDGQRHSFTLAADNRYVSNSAPQWLVERLGGITGTWQATTIDGQIFQFDRAGRLQRIISKDNLALEFSPAPRQKVSEMEMAGGFFAVEPYGRRLEIYTEARGFIAQIRGVDGYDMRYTVNDRDHLTAVQYPDVAQTASYIYRDNRLVEIQDARSASHPHIALDYYGDGRAYQYIENPTGTRREFTYEYTATTAQQRTFVNGQARVSRWTMDNQQRIINFATPQSGWNYSFEYSEAFTIYRQPDGGKLEFQVDEEGRLVRFSDPVYTLRGAIRFTYASGTSNDPYHQHLIEIAYPNGGYERFTYDEMGRLTAWIRLVSLSTGEENIIRYTYDSWGRLKTQTELDSDGQEVTTAYAYDEFGYLRTTTSGISQRAGETPVTTQTIYDRAGRLLLTHDGNGAQTVYRWNDRRNLVTRIEGPDQQLTTFQYHPVRPLIELKDDNGAQTTVAYNDLYQIQSVTNPLGKTTSYTLDEADNIRAIALPDSIYRFDYDNLDHLTRAVEPGGIETRYEQTVNPGTSAPMVHIHTEPTRQIQYIYDELGRLKRVDFSDGANNVGYALEYNIMGQVTRISEDYVNGRIFTATYDLLGRPLIVSLSNARTTYEYNPAGLLKRQTDSAGRVTDYAYDALGQLKTASWVESDNTVSAYQYRYDGNGHQVTITDPTNATTHYAYDAHNRLINIISPTGDVTAYQYDARGNLIGIKDPNANQQTAQYNALDLLEWTQDGAGNRTTFTYDDISRLARVVYPSGLTVDYTYDLNGDVVAVTQDQSREAYYGYDAGGRITSITDALGRTRTYNHNLLNRLIEAVDPSGGKQVYEWSLGGRLLSATDQNGRRYNYFADPLGRLSRIFDFSGEAREIALDTRFLYEGNSGRIARIRYGSENDLDTSNAIIHSFAYTNRGWVQSYTDPLGRVWQNEYDRAGRRIAAIDPNGTRTGYEYDTAGRIIAITNAEGTPDAYTETFAYDPAGNLARHTLPNDTIITYGYDPNNRIASITVSDSSGNTRAQLYSYDRAGRVAVIQGPADMQTEFTHDYFGNLQLISHINGETELRTRYQYDAVNNLIAMTMPEGGTASMTYNALNRRVRYNDALNKVWSYTYDNNGNLLQMSDPLGSVTEYEYDFSGRVSAIQYANGAIVTIKYDKYGNLQSVTGPQGEQPINPLNTPTITYTMDKAGQLIAIADASRNTIAYEYDAAGNLIRRTDANGVVTNYRYDARYHLIETRAPDFTLNYTYNTTGQLAEARNRLSNFRFVYNGFGEVVRALSSYGLDITYTRDSAGRVEQRSTPDWGNITYHYDSLGHLVQADFDSESVRFTYDTNGWRTGVERSNGVNTTIAYDANGHPTRITHLNTQTQQILDLFTYTYDDVGNVVRIERLDGWSVLYSYSDTHQVIDERWLDTRNQVQYAASYQYDIAGNRIESVITRGFGNPAERTLYVYDTENQLITETRNALPATSLLSYVPALLAAISIGGLGMRHRWSARRWAWMSLPVMTLFGIVPFSRALNDQSQIVRYGYDAHGNLTSTTYPADPPQILTFSYDGENRLTRVLGTSETGQQVDTAFTYDPLGRLTDWRNRNTRYRLYYDGQTVIGLENISTGERQTYYEVFPGERLLTVSNIAGPRWSLHDALGSLRKTAGPEGSASMPNFDFGAFGDVLSVQGNTRIDPNLAPMFAGQIYDPTTNLYIMNWRAYHPTLGRFIQRDPVRFELQGTLYTYAHNNPLAFNDPNGTSPEAALNATIVRIAPNLVPDTRPAPLTTASHAASNEIFLQQPEDELLRALDVMTQTRLFVNEPGAQMGPDGQQFYIYRVNPAPENAIVQSQRDVLGLLNFLTYGNRSGESPTFTDPRASIKVAGIQNTLPPMGPSPFPILHIPQSDDPGGIRLQREKWLAERLIEVPQYSGTSNHVQRLQNMGQPVYPVTTPPNVSIPQIVINPVSFGQFDILKQAQADYYAAERGGGR